ncbi:MAG TPA: glutamyl-tRNA reductase [Gammaproteobacteria bacterium]|nr:glutamyl-tRNA reductase [Gammaproteobacteria bacterium]
MLFVVGVSHKTAPLALRERLAVAPARVPELLDAMLEGGDLREAVLLSTCNRSELYAVTEAHRKAAVLASFRAIGDCDEEILPGCYVEEGPGAARHLFRVAAGLDSMVLGEAHILGQVRAAYLTAHRASAVGPELHQLFQHVLAATKNIRSDSSLDGLRSLPYAAAKLARERLGKFGERRAVLIGAGKTIDALAFHLRGEVSRLQIANRSPQAARALAARHGAEAILFADLPEALAEADLLASATTSETPVVSADMLHKRTGTRSLVVLDLAVPRDVAADVSLLAGVEVIGLDDLAAVIEASAELRYAAAEQAETAVEGALAGWQRARRIRDAVPTICALRAEASLARRQSLAAARRIAATRGSDEALEYLATTLTNRLIHAPTARLRAAAAADEATIIATARELFGLDNKGAQEDSAAA